MNTVLQTKGLCKTYIVNKRQNNVLKNIDLTIHEGEMVAIMGPSGSGKSTLLYCVSGMDRVTAGDVFFDGREITKRSDKELARLRLDEMGFIFQQMYMMKYHSPGGEIQEEHRNTKADRGAWTDTHAQTGH